MCFPVLNGSPMGPSQKAGPSQLWDPRFKEFLFLNCPGFQTNQGFPPQTYPRSQITFKRKPGFFPGPKFTPGPRVPFFPKWEKDPNL